MSRINEISGRTFPEEKNAVTIPPVTTNDELKNVEMELFDYNIKPKLLSKLETFDDWHNGIEEGGKIVVPGIKHIARELGAEEITVYVTPRGKPVNFYAVGDPDAPYKVLIKGGHEDEFTYLLSIYHMMASFLKNGKLTEKALKKIRIYFLECDDPDGFDMRAWTAVDMRGREKHWPPEYFSMFNGHTFEPISKNPTNLIVKDISKNIYVAGGTIYRDENGVYGDEIKSERILSILKFIDEEINPLHVAIDLHATYRGAGSAEVYNGAGILEIGHYPVEEETLEKIYSLSQKKKPYTLMGYFSIVPKIKKFLKNNTGFELGKAMMENVRKKGFKAYGGKFQDLLESPGLLPQLIPVDEGRTIMGWAMRDMGVAVCPEHLKNKYGTLGYTTETFPNSTAEAVLENMAYVEGCLKHIVNKW